ncbi:MAG: SDR family oxidoreductase [Herpetosiphon sp.]
MTQPTVNMHGKVCLVTGATSGIGEVTARELARMGATVIIVGRNQARTEAMVASISQSTGNNNVEYLLADLSVQRQVHQLAEQFKDRYSRLDVLVNNAGGIIPRRTLTEDGLELTFAVNHLAYFLLTELLLDVLKASAPARIVNVSSDAHRTGHIAFDDLQAAQNYGSFRAYSQSKLANVLFTYELARRLEGTGVTANCLHPGVVRTKFGQAGGWFGTALKVVGPFLRTPEKGAQTSIYLATSPAVEGVTGKYFSDSRPKQTNAESVDEQVAKRLWDVSNDLVQISA